MKKLLSLLLVAWCCGLVAQPVKIYFVDPGTVCPGDTLSVFFTWDYSPGATQFNVHSNSINQILSVSNSTFHTLPKSLVGMDTVYMIKMKMHPAHALGPGQISTDWVNVQPIYFMCSDPTGIGQNTPNVPYHTYRNERGEFVEPRVGELLYRDDRVKVLFTH